MISFVIRHLLESTFFCALLVLLAFSIRQGATGRYAVWLIAISKFAVPSILLAATGARAAQFWPATSWLSSWATAISTALTALLGLLPLSSIESSDSSASRILLLIWVLGAVAMLGIWCFRLLKTQRCLALPTTQERAAMNRALNVLRVHAPIRLRSSDSGAGPALQGLWHTTVVVPTGLSHRLTPSEFEAVLVHELAHARRFDNPAAVFVHLLVCIFWFHPLLWLVENRLSVERERACDELVIAAGRAPRIYASSIAKVCAFHLFQAPLGVSAMTGSDLKHRLELILASPLSKPLSYCPPLLIAGLAALAALVPMAGGYCRQCVSTVQAPAIRTNPCKSSPASNSGSSQEHARFNRACSK